MTPAQRLAALKAIRFGIDHAIEQAEYGVRELINATGAERFGTGMGQVILVQKDPTITFDEAELLAFAESTDLDGVEVIKEVRRTFRSLFKISGRHVVFAPTGEIIDWAKIRPGTTYLSTRLNDDTKTHIESIMAERVDTLTGLLELGQGDDHDGEGIIEG